MTSSLHDLERKLDAIAIAVERLTTLVTTSHAATSQAIAELRREMMVGVSEEDTLRKEVIQRQHVLEDSALVLTTTVVSLAAQMTSGQQSYESQVEAVVVALGLGAALEASLASHVGRRHGALEEAAGRLTATVANLAAQVAAGQEAYTAQVESMTRSVVSVGH